MKFILLVFFLIAFPVRAQHFVLVSGLNNEQVSAYFSSFESWLRSKNFNKISQINPSSLNTVMDNVPTIKIRLLDLYDLYREPLIIVAHSKGGLEVANTLAQFADKFPTKVVQKIIYANVPFQGSPYMSESVREYEDQWGHFGNQYNPVYLNALDVLKSLETERILSDLEASHRQLSTNERESLSKRSFFLRTQKAADKVSIILKKSAEYLKGSANDGLIPTENQMRDGFGNDLGVLKDIDHTDLFVRRWDLASREAKLLEILPLN